MNLVRCDAADAFLILWLFGYQPSLRSRPLSDSSLCTANHATNDCLSAKRVPHAKNKDAVVYFAINKCAIEANESDTAVIFVLVLDVADSHEIVRDPFCDVGPVRRRVVSPIDPGVNLFDRQGLSGIIQCKPAYFASSVKCRTH